MKKLLELKNINMVFSKRGSLLRSEKFFHVLKDINLDIYEGEIVALIGESGCGKTTIGRIITGLQKPTSGELRYEGKNIYAFIKIGQEFDTYRRYVQFVQQDSYAALNPVRTIRQSLEAPIRTHNKQIRAEQLDTKLHDLLELVGLLPAEQFLDKYPHQLSGGQRQRILMARALSLSPKLIVADEPVSMIDVSLRLSILKLMSDLNRKMGVVFVYITHDLSTARYIARNNRIVVMYLGEIMEEGDAEKIISDPRHPYTQSLISAIPIPHPDYAQLDKELPIKSMEMESLDKPKKGCPFFQRCLYADALCKEPVDYVVVGNRKIKCCRLDQVPAFVPITKRMEEHNG
mgnify:CR=1 FL=1